MRFRRAHPADPPVAPRSMRSRMLIGAGAGAGAVLAFAPFGYWPLQIISLALLFYQVLRAGTPKSGFLIGWAYGSAWFAAGMYWLFISMHRYGDMAAPLAALAVALLAALMGLYAGLAMAGAAWLRRRWTLSLPLSALLLLPALWLLQEWCRGWFFTGLPWVASGYAHTASPLAGYAPVLGVYGLGWLAALSAGALLLLAHRTRLAAAGLVLAIFAAGHTLGWVRWTEPVGKPLTVRLLQGNVPQDEKFNPAHVRDALRMYHAAATAGAADLIATPETAVTVFEHQLPPDYLDSLRHFARSSGSHLLLGLPLLDGQQVSNSAIGIAPGNAPGAPAYRYDKHHLVPFGESTPDGLHWLVSSMAIPLGDMRRGAAVQAPFPVRGQLVLPNICYEDLFGEEIAGQLAAPHRAGERPATILINMSNLAWFGESTAIPQHLQISQMRSLETGRPMLRAGNSGGSAVIDGRGVVVSRLAPYTRGTLAASVQGMAGMTPYIVCGNALILGIAALALAGAGLLARRSRKNPV
ncbi:apolipoprotein N-acyltransferase [Janthinobacterium fluminis]|uniref:Apolipoprotein N-acyltransferase n=1 Tax=Janthinobacterium fluminis TaxID=2987524 RepID=A0ABT5K1C6_9BURK|nr:apolipoprotein N-acyltransferase [Janthinobacterium fluminis]MDC8758782.1 apolipoprotein N-acyltransferase [Janthinobacterium fluminis]